MATRHPIVDDVSITRSRVNELSSLEKGLRILRELASSKQGLTAAQLSQVAGLNRTTVYRLSEMLARDGWIQRMPDGDDPSRFDIGPTMQGLAILITNKYDHEEKIQPIINELARSASAAVHVAALDGTEIVHIAVARPDVGMYIAGRVGSRQFAHAAAVGKVLLAALPDEEVRRRYGAEKLPQNTPKTIPTVSALLAELAVTRSRGYAINDEEARPGVFCIAAPVFGPGGEALFAFSVPILPQEARKRRGEIVNAVREAANLATRSFGGREDEWRAVRGHQDGQGRRSRSRKAGEQVK